ncbi:hypothetical protein ABT024_38730 [Streptomyces sp. NPDC002812]|uniref:hypothetical protein n=1 Tax=Streptomyces sp. NPDC002812 TaxID=3154434 RepID=UPI0033288B46
MSETDPHRTATAPELLTLLTDGIVELRKRRQIAAHRAAGPGDPEGRLAAMARRAAARAGHPLV